MHLDDQKERFSQRPGPKSWGTSAEPISLTTVFVNETDKLSLSELKLGILLQVWRVQTETGSTSQRIGRTRTSTAWNSYQKFSKVGRIDEGSELRVDESSRRRSIEDQDTINELTARTQELQNEVNCMNDSTDFQDVESVGQLCHVPNQPVLFQSSRGKLGGMLHRDQSPRPDIWNPHGTSGNVFAILPAFASTLYAGMFNSWDSDVTVNIPSANWHGERRCRRWRAKPRHCPYSEISAKTVTQKSVQPYGGKTFKELWSRPTKLQISELYIDNFLPPETFSWWKIRF